MRTVFTIELSTDVSVGDEARRKAFIDLMKKACRTLYAQTAMLSDTAVIDIAVQSEDSMNGVKSIDLFDKGEV
jgi:hypothetical protein